MESVGIELRRHYKAAGQRPDGTDDDKRPQQELPEARNKQGARTASQTRHDDVGLATQCLRGNAPEICDTGDPHKNLMNAFFQYFHIGPRLAPQWPWWNNLV